MRVCTGEFRRGAQASRMRTDSSCLQGAVGRQLSTAMNVQDGSHPRHLLTLGGAAHAVLDRDRTRAYACRAGPARAGRPRRTRQKVGHAPRQQCHCTLALLLRLPLPELLVPALSLCSRTLQIAAATPASDRVCRLPGPPPRLQSSSTMQRSNARSARALVGGPASPVRPRLRRRCARASMPAPKVPHLRRRESLTRQCAPVAVLHSITRVVERRSAAHNGRARSGAARAAGRAARARSARSAERVPCDTSAWNEGLRSALFSRSADGTLRPYWIRVVLIVVLLCAAA